MGAKCVLIAEIDEGGFFNGHTAVRLKDVTAVKRVTSFAERFAWTQPEWPPTAPRLASTWAPLADEVDRSR